MDLGFSPVIDATGGLLRPNQLVDWQLSNPGKLYEYTYSQQDAYNKHIEEREDSAVQRWVEDVRKAGLNPWAFTGSGSSTSTLTSPHSTAFDSMLSYLKFDLSKASNSARNILGAVKIGAGLASSIIGALS